MRPACDTRKYPVSGPEPFRLRRVAPLMLSAAKCRAKARDALANAERALDPVAARDWRETAAQWRSLGAMAGFQDTLRAIEQAR